MNEATNVNHTNINTHISKEIQRGEDESQLTVKLTVSLSLFLTTVFVIIS